MLLEIEIRLWWLQERVSFIHMEVERVRQWREYQLYLRDANEKKDVIFHPWIPQSAGSRLKTICDGGIAGYPSSLKGWFR